MNIGSVQVEGCLMILSDGARELSKLRDGNAQGISGIYPEPGHSFNILAVAFFFEQLNYFLGWHPVMIL